MSETFATIEATEETFQEMLRLSTMAGYSDYEKAYINVGDDVVRVFSAVTGGSASSYATFEAPEYLTSAGPGPAADDASGEALIDIQKFDFFLDVVSGPGTITVEFRGEPDRQLPTVVEMTGDLQTSVHIPANEEILKQMPIFLSDRFTDDIYHGQDGTALTTFIETDTDTLERVAKPVESEEYLDIDYFPIVVSDGQLELRAGGENNRDRIWGALEGAAAEGPDVANLYDPDLFDPVLRSLVGEVELQTAPGDNGAPLAVVKEIQGGTIRHVIAPAGAL